MADSLGTTLSPSDAVNSRAWQKRRGQTKPGRRQAAAGSFGNTSQAEPSSQHLQPDVKHELPDEDSFGQESPEEFVTEHGTQSSDRGQLSKQKERSGDTKSDEIAKDKKQTDAQGAETGQNTNQEQGQKPGQPGDAASTTTPGQPKYAEPFDKQKAQLDPGVVDTEGKQRFDSGYQAMKAREENDKIEAGIRGNHQTPFEKQMAERKHGAGNSNVRSGSDGITKPSSLSGNSGSANQGLGSGPTTNRGSLPSGANGGSGGGAVSQAVSGGLNKAAGGMMAAAGGKNSAGDHNQEKSHESENAKQVNEIRKTAELLIKSGGNPEKLAMDYATEQLKEALKNPGQYIASRFFSVLHTILDAFMTMWMGLMSIFVIPDIGLFAFRLSKNGDSKSPARMSSVVEMGQHGFAIIQAMCWLMIWSGVILFAVYMYVVAQNSWGCKNFSWAVNLLSRHTIGTDACQSTTKPATTGVTTTK